MIISSWNVNSVRARIDNIKVYINKFSPDILLLQEIKTENINFPILEFKKLKYECYVHGQKSYNGVAIISKKKINNININLIKDKNKQARIMSSDFFLKKKKIKLINIYIPNGNPVDTEKYNYKIEWLEKLIKKLKVLIKENENIIIAGDFNIIPTPDDVYSYKRYEDDALYRLEIRKKFREIINLGFHDSFRYINGNKQEYTFWDYMSGAWQKNNGMRIDHFLVSSSLIKNIQNTSINKYPRAQIKPSDHTPIEIELK